MGNIKAVFDKCQVNIASIFAQTIILHTVFCHELPSENNVAILVHLRESYATAVDGLGINLVVGFDIVHCVQSFRDESSRL